MEIEQPRVLNLRDFSRPKISTSTSCIVLEEVVRNYELKNTYIKQLPSFYGMPNEDPLNFIREYYSIIQTFPLRNLNEDQLRMRCFTYTLKERAKSWLLSLPSNSLPNWEAIYNKFIGKFYSHEKTSNFRRKIATFSQSDEEAFHESWERFKAFLIQCPHHQYPQELITQFFYDGLGQTFQSMVDNAVGGDVGILTAQEVYNLFENLSNNSQQKSTRTKINNINIPGPDVNKEIAELKKQVQILQNTSAINETVKACNIYKDFRHGPNVCNSTFGTPEPIKHGNAIQNFQKPSQNNPYSTTYNPGWRNHPNFSWVNTNTHTSILPQLNSQKPQSMVVQPFNQPVYQPNPLPQSQNYQASYPIKPPIQSSLEETLNKFIQTTGQRFESTDKRIDSLESTVRILTTAVDHLTSKLGNSNKESEKFPSKPEQALAINTLKCEKEVDKIKATKTTVRTILNNKEISSDRHNKENQRINLHKSPNPYKPPQSTLNKQNITNNIRKTKFYLHKSPNPYKPPIPLSNGNKNKTTYKNHRFMKNRKKTPYNVLRNHLPLKESDPGSFIINMAIGNTNKIPGMLDLGATINLMSYSTFKQIEPGEIKPTKMILELADKTLRKPKGILEDILVEVGGLVVPTDFVVLEYDEDTDHNNKETILLGRPFMATTNTLIDVRNGGINMTVMGKSATFSIHDTNSISVTYFPEKYSFIDKIDSTITNISLQKSEINKEILKMKENTCKNKRREEIPNSQTLKQFKNLRKTNSDEFPKYLYQVFEKGTKTSNWIV